MLKIIANKNNINNINSKKINLENNIILAKNNKTNNIKNITNP